MINAFNAANEELKQKMEGNKWDTNKANHEDNSRTIITLIQS
jgi:hypothetical protein